MQEKVDAQFWKPFTFILSAVLEMLVFKFCETSKAATMEASNEHANQQSPYVQEEEKIAFPLIRLFVRESMRC